MGLNPDSGPGFVPAYILVFSTALEQHLKHLRLVLQRLSEVGSKLNSGKCHFVRKEVEYLGHILTLSDLKPDQTLVRAVRDRVPSPNLSTGVKEISGASL